MGIEKATSNQRGVPASYVFYIIKYYLLFHRLDTYDFRVLLLLFRNWDMYP